MRAWQLTLQTLFLIAVAGCGNYHEDYGSAKNVDRFSTHGFKTLGFEAVKAIVFNDYCKSCHLNGVSKGGVSLDKFEGASAHATDIKADILTNRMPEGDPLPDFQKAVLLAWIADGAKEVSTTPIPDPNAKPPPPPPPPPPGFDKISSSILQPHCVRCHSEFANYDLVVATWPDIMKDIKSGDMPKNEKPLTDRQIKQLEAWDKAGKLKGFTEISTKLFVPYCIRCHANFKDVRNVSAIIDEIQDMVKQNKMPKDDDPVPDDLKALLADWVKAGMPD